MFVCIYVDDLIFTGTSLRMFNDFKKAMEREFEMSDMGLMSYYLGMEVKQMKDGIFILQKGYAKTILKKFNMSDCKPVITPMKVGTKLSKVEEDPENVNPTMFKVLWEV